MTTLLAKSSTRRAVRWVAAFAVMLQAMYVVPCECAAASVSVRAVADEPADCCSPRSCCDNSGACQCERICGCSQDDRSRESSKAIAPTSTPRTAATMPSVREPLCVVVDQTCSYDSDSVRKRGKSSLEYCVLLSRLTL